jgi:hypothetical protein
MKNTTTAKLPPYEWLTDTTRERVEAFNTSLDGIATSLAKVGESRAKLDSKLVEATSEPSRKDLQSYRDLKDDETLSLIREYKLALTRSEVFKLIEADYRKMRDGLKAEMVAIEESEFERLKDEDEDVVLLAINRNPRYGKLFADYNLDSNLIKDESARDTAERITTLEKLIDSRL